MDLEGVTVEERAVPKRSEKRVIISRSADNETRERGRAWADYSATVGLRMLPAVVKWQWSRSA